MKETRMQYFTQKSNCQPAVFMIFIDYLEEERTIPSEYHMALLVSLTKEITKKKPQMINKLVFLYKDNVSCNNSFVTMKNCMNCTSATTVFSRFLPQRLPVPKPQRNTCRIWLQWIGGQNVLWKRHWREQCWCKSRTWQKKFICVCYYRVGNDVFDYWFVNSIIEKRIFILFLKGKICVILSQCIMCAEFRQHFAISIDDFVEFLFNSVYELVFYCGINVS